MWTSSSWWKETGVKAFPFQAQELGSRSWLVPGYTWWECRVQAAEAAWVGARAWIGWHCQEGCVSSKWDPALWGSLFRGLQCCETQHSSEERVEAFQMYTLYCTAQRGQGSHSFTHFPNLFILIAQHPPVLAKKNVFFKILTLCLCADLYRFQHFVSLYRFWKLQAQ